MSDLVDVEVDGHRVRVLIDGNTGPVVVLCSGLGGRALHWGDTVRYLADDHTLVRFDRPGTPVTDDRVHAPTVRGEADRIAAVLDAAGQPDRVVLVGHSVGGYYAEAFARLYPHRTRALLLLDSSIAPDRQWLALPLRTKLAITNAAASLLNKLHLQTPLGRAGLTLVQRLRPGGLDAQMRSEIRRAATEPGFIDALLAEYVAYHNLADELCALRHHHPLPPVRRVVATAHTGWRTRGWRNQQIRLAKNIGAEQITVAPAGHLVMIEQPRRAADLIRAVA
ncbi:hypothetical protein A5634_19260 [Mycobacterium asiaticum]|uniref:AB hydrolase-1 domain-containing protein n=1 Tax=Mycobacterium asiaticum TaxID=1790 RepID=A0A1A3P3W1_MYCAS|nr:alpha/beta hydrolase [Mycobacterium asiaticum]OBK28948.1 hypothetical protein A5634_19260 [Mycobacterium asiaticum]